MDSYNTFDNNNPKAQAKKQFRLGKNANGNPIGGSGLGIGGKSAMFK